MNAFSLLLLVATAISATPSVYRNPYENPSGYDNRPSSYDNRPSSYDNRPSSYGKRPSSYDNRPSSYGNRQPSNYAGGRKDYDKRRPSYEKTYQPDRSDKNDNDSRPPVIIDHGGLPPRNPGEDQGKEPVIIDHGGLNPEDHPQGQDNAGDFEPDAAAPAPDAAPVVVREKPFRIRDRIAFKVGEMVGTIRAVPSLIKNTTGKALKSIGELFKKAGGKLHKPNYWATCELKVFTRYMKLMEYERAIGEHPDRMRDYFVEGEMKTYLSLKEWATKPENKKIYAKRRQEAYKKYGKNFNHDTGY